MTKDANFKFGRRAPPDHRDRMPEKLFSKGVWPSSRDPVNCMALSANSYKMVKATARTSNLCQFR